jgi:hypothetical protein
LAAVLKNNAISEALIFRHLGNCFNYLKISLCQGRNSAYICIRFRKKALFFEGLAKEK